MRFGLFGGARTKRSVGLGDSHGYKDFIDYVQEAEKLGFQKIIISKYNKGIEHVVFLETTTARRQRCSKPIWPYLWPH